MTALHIKMQNSTTNYVSQKQTNNICSPKQCYFLGGLAVSVLATGPTGHSVAGSSPTEDGGFLWVIKVRSTHFLPWGSKPVGPMS
jgi:hypothetical protein